MRLELHPDARLELQAAVDWYDSRDARAADDFDQAIRAALKEIQDHPRAWTPVIMRRAAGLGIRQLVLRRFPFTLPYVVREELVVVLAVAHVRRRPGYWLKRLESVGNR